MTKNSQHKGLTLDTGALIAIERETDFARALVLNARSSGTPIAIPAGVLAQAWRGGARQTPIARLIKDPIVECPPLDQFAGIQVGRVCAHTGTSDVIDAHVALIARERGYAVVTSDPDDIRAIDPSLRIIEI